MENNLLPGIFAAISIALFFYFFLSQTIGQEGYEQRKIQDRLKSLFQIKRDSIVSRVNRRSFISLHKVVEGSEVLEGIDELLKLTTWNLSPEKFLFMSGALGFIVFWITNILLENFEIASATMLVSIFIPYFFLQLNRKKYIQQFVINFPDALSMMKNSVKAGQGIQSAFKAVSMEAPYPINREFKRMITEVDLGSHLEDALNALYRRIKTVDVRMFILGLTIQMEIGGNISELFDNIAQTIRNRITLKRELAAATSQAKASAMFLIAIPIFIFFLLNHINPEYMKPLLKEDLGHKILMGVGVMLIIGSSIILKMVQGPKLA